MRKFTAGINDDGVRLSRFCEKVCHNIPKSLLHKSFRNKRIKVNGKKQDAEYRIQQNDLIELYINDEFFTPTIGEKFVPVAYDNLDVLYEDYNILIIFKPTGLICHSDDKKQSNLVDIIQSYLFEKGDYLPDNESTFTPALCNRIDQGTEGIVLAAKNYKALAEMNEIIRENLLLKQYLCVTKTKPTDGEYHAYLTRDLTDKKVTVTSYETPISKEIITDFKVVSVKDGLCLVECSLITGRTHQIRAHLAFLGYPVIGDKKYGKPVQALDSQLLSAYKILFKSLPPESLLAYLSNKEFKCKHCSVLEFFNNL